MKDKIDVSVKMFYISGLLVFIFCSTNEYKRRFYIFRPQAIYTLRFYDLSHEPLDNLLPFEHD